MFIEKLQRIQHVSTPNIQNSDEAMDADGLPSHVSKGRLRVGGFEFVSQTTHDGTQNVERFSATCVDHTRGQQLTAAHREVGCK